MTSKGQVTVPKEVRDDLGLVTGSKIVFVRTDEGAYLLEPARISIKDLAGCLNYDGPPMTIEDMQEGIIAGACASAGFEYTPKYSWEQEQ